MYFIQSFVSPAEQNLQLEAGDEYRTFLFPNRHAQVKFIVIEIERNRVSSEISALCADFLALGCRRFSALYRMCGC